MKRLCLLLSIAIAGLGVGCSGGSRPAPPPPAGGFTKADLNGQYAFLMSGTDAGGFFGRVGVFVADGNGHITGGIEDVNTGQAGEQTLTFSASTYSIQADGRGTVQLTNQTGTLTFSVTLLSPSQGYIVQTDAIATTSGTFNLQTPSAFTATAINGPYVFDVTGIAPDANNNFFSDSIVGQMVASGGVINGGVGDENFDASLSGPQAIANGTSALDATNGTTFGRGTLSFDLGGSTFSYIYYIVDGSRIRLMETNTTALTLGDAVAQVNAPTSDAAFTGSFAYLMGGSSASTGGSLTRIGRFTSNGNGGLTAIAGDTNDSGLADQVPSGSLSSMTYDIDANFPGSGRGTATYTDSKLGTFSFIFYMASPTQGVIQDVSQNNIADGSIVAQTGGPFSTGNLAASWGFNWSGISSNSQTGVTAEEDYVGHVALTSSASNNLTGAVDFSEFSSNNGVFLDVVVNGPGLTIGGDGTTGDGNRNSLQAKINSNPSGTIKFAAYVVNPNTIFVAGTDSNRVIAGTLSRQSK